MSAKRFSLVSWVRGHSALATAPAGPGEPPIADRTAAVPAPPVLRPVTADQAGRLYVAAKSLGLDSNASLTCYFLTRFRTHDFSHISYDGYANDFFASSLAQLSEYDHIPS